MAASKRKKAPESEAGRGARDAFDRYRVKKTKVGQRRIILIASVVAVVGILIVYAIVASLPPYPARTPPLGSIAVGLAGSAAHIHAHLDIYLDGRSIPVPANFGHLPDGRFYALHAHDDDGVIHIEPMTAGQTFTLGQIFLVWGWSLDSNHIFDKTGLVTLYVNGATTAPFDTALRLNCLDEIVLVYGTPPATIPSSYNFQPGACA